MYEFEKLMERRKKIIEKRDTVLDEFFYFEEKHSIENADYADIFFEEYTNLVGELEEVDRLLKDKYNYVVEKTEI